MRRGLARGQMYKPASASSFLGDSCDGVSGVRAVKFQSVSYLSGHFIAAAEISRICPINIKWRREKPGDTKCDWRGVIIRKYHLACAKYFKGASGNCWNEAVRRENIKSVAGTLSNLWRWR